MKNITKTTCPECQGNKTIAGNCVCNMEWRGVSPGNDMDDCQCSATAKCPACHGSGYISHRK